MKCYEEVKMRLLMFRELGRPRREVSGAGTRIQGSKIGVRLIYPWVKKGRKSGVVIEGS